MPFCYSIGLWGFTCRWLTLQIYSTDQTFILKVRYLTFLHYRRVFNLEDQIKQPNAEKLP